MAFPGLRDRTGKPLLTSSMAPPRLFVCVLYGRVERLARSHWGELMARFCSGAADGRSSSRRSVQASVTGLPPRSFQGRCGQKEIDRGSSGRVLHCALTVSTGDYPVV